MTHDIARGCTGKSGYFMETHLKKKRYKELGTEKESERERERARDRSS